MDPLHPPFLATHVDGPIAYDVVIAADADPAVTLTGTVAGPAAPCRFCAIARCPDAIATAATRFVITLDMELPELGELEVALIETLSPARDPERELGVELDHASDPAIARGWFDVAVQAAWLAIQSDWRYDTACTLHFHAGRCVLRGPVAAWDRRRMDKLVAVMIALAAARPATRAPTAVGLRHARAATPDL